MKKITFLFLAAAGALVCQNAAAVLFKPLHPVPLVQWACIKNETHILMRANIYVLGRHSKRSKPVRRGKTVCYDLPRNASFVGFYAKPWLAGSQGAAGEIHLKRETGHTHVSFTLRTNWNARKSTMSGPYYWTECDNCDYLQR